MLSNNRDVVVDITTTEVPCVLCPRAPAAGFHQELPTNSCFVPELIKHRASVPAGCLHCAAISIKLSRALPAQPAWVGRTKSRSIPIQLPSRPLGQGDSARGLGDITELPHQPGRGPLQPACTFWGQFTPFSLHSWASFPYLCCSLCPRAGFEQGTRGVFLCFYPTSQCSPQAGPKGAPEQTPQNPERATQ